MWFGGKSSVTERPPTVEGQLVTGKDKLHLLTDGPVFGEVPSSTSILAGGAIFSLESRNQHLRVNVLGGNMSELGAGAQSFTGSVTARHGVEGGFFLEGNLAEPRWFATTGDFSYAGLGYVVNRAGARVIVGAGSGAYLGVHVPVRGFELDITARDLSPRAKVENPSGFVSIGLKKVFTLR